MDFGNLHVLANFENLNAFKDKERNYNDKNNDDVCDQDEWQEPTQEYVRYMEEIRDAIRDQLPR